VYYFIVSIVIMLQKADIFKDAVLLVYAMLCYAWHVPSHMCGWLDWK